MDYATIHSLPSGLTRCVWVTMQLIKTDVPFRLPCTICPEIWGASLRNDGKLLKVGNDIKLAGDRKVTKLAVARNNIKL